MDACTFVLDENQLQSSAITAFKNYRKCNKNTCVLLFIVPSVSKIQICFFRFVKYLMGCVTTMYEINFVCIFVKRKG